jgi:hypothetical protein
MQYLQFNHLAVLVSAVYQWVLGALWYSLFFAKPWTALTGEKMCSKPDKTVVAGMISSFIGGLILSFLLLHVVLWSVTDTIERGLFVGLACWVGFIAVPLFAETMYERRSLKLFAINSGYWLVALLGSSCLFAVWQ